MRMTTVSERRTHSQPDYIPVLLDVPAWELELIGGEAEDDEHQAVHLRAQGPGQDVRERSSGA